MHRARASKEPRSSPMTQSRMTNAGALPWVAALVVMVAPAPPTFAQPMARRVMGGAAAGGQVNLPYVVQDNQGNQWRIYQYGYLQQQGNMPLYSQGAMLMINGNQPVQRMNT